MNAMIDPRCNEEWFEDDVCQECDGAGEIMDCCDDMCIGSGSCIHGSMRICPACRGSGESWTSGKEETK